MRKARKIILFVVAFALLATIVSAFDIRDVNAPVYTTKIVYGTSGEGRELVAYKFGNGNNVLVAGFGIHGYEDNFDKDGGCLVYTADKLMQLLDANRQLITDYGWSIYILPSMNPDGLIDGTSCNGPGRCTTTYLDANGNLVRGTGVDLNRSFPTNWTHYSSARNFNGSRALSAKEAQALAAFVQKVKGKGNNICLDVHGWMSQIITSTGKDGTLFKTFANRFPNNTYANCTNASGYFTAYTTSLGYNSCLFEFPDGLYSMDAFKKSGYCESFNACVLDLLKSYGTYNAHSLTCASADFSDVIPWKWYHSAIDYVLEHQIFNGVSDTSFAPNTAMTRAMLVATLWRISNKTKDEECSAAEPVQDSPNEQLFTFSDVPSGEWYSEAVAWAAENGIVNGMSDGSFRPMNSVTREQMTTIFYRYAQWCGKSVTTDANLSGFPDTLSVSAYAIVPMTWANKFGLIQGVADGSQTYLMPKNIVTRAQAAQVIMRYLNGSNSAANRKSSVITMEPNICDDPVADSGN